MSGRDYTEVAQLQHRLDELATLIRVLRDYTWTPADVPSVLRDHPLYPGKHTGSKRPLWTALDTAIAGLGQGAQ